MFKRDVRPLSDVLSKLLRQEGLEMPLQQRRVVAAWDSVVGPTIARYTQQKFIRNQTLYVQLSSPALRSELSMVKQRLVTKLNEQAGATQVITDIHFF